MDKQQNRSGGPRSPEGLVNSSGNSFKHGCCSKQVIVKGESAEDFEALQEWWFGQYEGEGAARPLVEEAVLNEWLLKRTQRNYLAVDARLQEMDPNDWTAEQIHRLGLMQRYKTAAERAFHRSLGAVERFRRTRVYEALAQQRAEWQAEEHERRRLQQEEDDREPEPSFAERVAKLPPPPKVEALVQHVNVSVVEGKTVTKLLPPNAELLAKAAALEVKPGRVFRRLLVRPKTVPEYAWMAESLPGPTEAREQIMQYEEWLRALEREKGNPDGHIGPVERDPTWKTLDQELQEMDERERAEKQLRE